MLFRSDLNKFPDPTEMIDDLHLSGFDVTLWTTPFVNAGSKREQEVLDNKYYVRSGRNAESSKVHWWQCQDPNNKKCGWILDFTNPDAFDWQTAAFRNLVENYGIGGREKIMTKTQIENFRVFIR